MLKANKTEPTKSNKSDWAKNFHQRSAQHKAGAKNPDGLHLSQTTQPTRTPLAPCLILKRPTKERLRTPPKRARTRLYWFMVGVCVYYLRTAISFCIFLSRYILRGVVINENKIIFISSCPRRRLSAIFIDTSSRMSLISRQKREHVAAATYSRLKCQAFDKHASITFRHRSRKKNNRRAQAADKIFPLFTRVS